MADNKMKEKEDILDTNDLILDDGEHVDIEADGVDRVEQYFELKELAKTLRQDIKDMKEQHDDWEELQELKKQVKDINENIKGMEDIRIVDEKLKGVKEKMGLIKEIIMTELIETGAEEVKKDGRKLKLVQTIKEMKDDNA